MAQTPGKSEKNSRHNNQAKIQKAGGMPAGGALRLFVCTEI